MKIFLSYASNDQIEYKVEEIVDFLEFQDDIEQVYYWERDTKGDQTFDDYMTNNIEKIGPEVGENNEEIYCDLLGYSLEDLKRWKLKKII